MKRMSAIIATAITSLGLIAFSGSSAEASSRSAGSQVSSAAEIIHATSASEHAVEASSMKSKDKKFVKYMTSSQNPDYKLYRHKSTKKLHKLGVSVCNLIKAYDADGDSDEDAILETYSYITENDEHPYTDDGDAYLVVVTIHTYCTQYREALDAI